MIVFKCHNKLTGMQLIALGFFLLILIGTFLLMLPISTKPGESTDFITALFTSTSAACVTGLVLTDTFTHWTIFGQLVLLGLIQIGGLGFITLGVSASLALHKKIGLKARGNLQNSVNALQLGGIVRLAKHILKGTLIFEGIGALLLSIRFVPKMGLITGIYYGIFHSISAFCNAGFDLMGRFSPGSSFTAYSGDWFVCLTLIALILIGGLGFIVWENIYVYKLNFKRYSLHSKMVLASSAFLILTGTILFFFAEKDNILLGRPFDEQVLCSLFGAVTPRTAGFNTVDNAALTDAGKFISTVLMFIGGAPGSTAGGVKVTTIFVLVLTLRSTLTHTKGINIFGRRLEADAPVKAVSVFFLNLSLSLIVGFIICCTQHFSLADTMFEVISAISTVGMSAGLTGQLNLLSKILIISLMYIGRVGSLSFALAFTDRKKTAHIMQPAEAINIG